MKRLFAILLICLLPVQVFAGMLTYKTAIDSAALEQQVQQQEQLRQALELAAVVGNDANAGIADDVVAQQQALADSTDGDDDDLSYADTEDFSSHAGVGDETVLNPTMAFVSDSATLAPALRSDDARQPPFLPLAGRPPRA